MDCDQLEVYDYVKKHLEDKKLFNIVVVGPGGTGKSFLLNEITKLLETKNHSYQKCAPTGVAAQLIGGKTVHGLFKLHHDKCVANYIDLQSQINCIICDEAFMLGVDIYDMIRQKMHRDIYKTDPPANLDFIGFVPNTSHIFMGDPLQLAPVKADCMWSLKVVDKMAHLWSGKTKYAMLRTNHRSLNDGILTSMLMIMRQSAVIQPVFSQLLQEHCQVENIDVKYSLKKTKHNYICFAKNTASDINQTLLDVQSSKTNPVLLLKPKQVKLKLSMWSYAVSEQDMPTDFKFVIGSRVVLKRNLDVESGIVNGLQGYVQSVTKGNKLEGTETYITVNFDNGRVYPVPRQEYVQQGTNMKSKGLVDMVTQFPLMLSYALNIHRLQGTTLETCTILLRDICWTSNSLYVALSRCVSCAGITLKYDTRTNTVATIIDGRTAFSKDSINTNEVIIKLCSEEAAMAQEMLESYQKQRTIDKMWKALPKDKEDTQFRMDHSNGEARAVGSAVPFLDTDTLGATGVWKEEEPVAKKPKTECEPFCLCKTCVLKQELKMPDIQPSFGRYEYVPETMPFEEDPQPPPASQFFTKQEEYMNEINQLCQARESAQAKIREHYADLHKMHQEALKPLTLCPRDDLTMYSTQEHHLVLGYYSTKDKTCLPTLGLSHKLIQTQNRVMGDKMKRSNQDLTVFYKCTVFNFAYPVNFLTITNASTFLNIRMLGCQPTQWEFLLETSDGKDLNKMIIIRRRHVEEELIVHFKNSHFMYIHQSNMLVLC